MSSRVLFASGGERKVMATEVSAAEGRFKTAIRPPNVSMAVVVVVVLVETVMLLMALEKGDVVIYSANAVGGFCQGTVT